MRWGWPPESVKALTIAERLYYVDLIKKQIDHEREEHAKLKQQAAAVAVRRR